jgi:hypothetical protein
VSASSAERSTTRAPLTPRTTAPGAATVASSRAGHGQRGVGEAVRAQEHSVELLLPPVQLEDPPRAVSRQADPASARRSRFLEVGRHRTQRRSCAIGVAGDAPQTPDAEYRGDPGASAAGNRIAAIRHRSRRQRRKAASAHGLNDDTVADASPLGRGTARMPASPAFTVFGLMTRGSPFSSPWPPIETAT